MKYSYKYYYYCLFGNIFYFSFFIHKDNPMTPSPHNRRSIRLKGYDYSRAGLYFITICTKDRLPLFGEIGVGADTRVCPDNEKFFPVMTLNDAGMIARDEWVKTAVMRPNIEIDAFVVMPNHVHGIIVINDIGIDYEIRRGTMHRAPTYNNAPTDNNDYANNEFPPTIPRTGTVPRAPTCNNAPTYDNDHANNEFSPTISRTGTVPRAPQIEQFGKPTSNTIPTIIRGYKSAVTARINTLRNTPGASVWQRNYYEHIIRDEESYRRIAEYIHNNPANWREDDYYGP